MHRAAVPFDTKHFSKEQNAGKQMSVEEKFSYIYKTNFWSGPVSVSGEGSDDVQTQTIRTALPELFHEFKIKSMLDIPCGDFNWMKKVDLKDINYIGADIVEDIITVHQAAFADEQKKFYKLNLINDPLPCVDLVFCRDCLVHFSYEDIFTALNNLKKSGSGYILTTTFPECESNEDIITGDWRILNLTKTPFKFPEPLYLINENCTEGNGTYLDKSLGMWRLSDLL